MAASNFDAEIKQGMKAPAKRSSTNAAPAAKPPAASNTFNRMPKPSPAAPATAPAQQAAAPVDTMAAMHDTMQAHMAAVQAHMAAMKGGR